MDNQQKAFITPNKASYKNDNIVYDLKCSSFDYFPCMVFMMKEVEKEEEKIYNVFPIEMKLLQNTYDWIQPHGAFTFTKTHGNKRIF